MEINKRNYQDLRYSLFNERNRDEYQTRIEYSDGKFIVYSLANRASLLGKPYEFDNFSDAKQRFLKNLDLTVKYNSRRVENNEKPEYISKLWQ